MPWAKGQSGNPLGRPKLRDDISRVARQYGPAGIDRLAQFAGLAPGGTIADSTLGQISAIKELLDRGYGKAAQLVVGDEDRPVAIRFEWAPAEPTPVITGEAVDTDAVTVDTAAVEPEPDQLQITWESEPSE